MLVYKTRMIEALHKIRENIKAHFREHPEFNTYSDGDLVFANVGSFKGLYILEIESEEDERFRLIDPHTLKVKTPSWLQGKNLINPATDEEKQIVHNMRPANVFSFGNIVVIREQAASENDTIFYKIKGFENTGAAILIEPLRDNKRREAPEELAINMRLVNKDEQAKYDAARNALKSFARAIPILDEEDTADTRKTPRSLAAAENVKTALSSLEKLKETSFLSELFEAHGNPQKPLSEDKSTALTCIQDIEEALLEAQQNLE